METIQTAVVISPQSPGSTLRFLRFINPRAGRNPSPYPLLPPSPQHPGASWTDSPRINYASDCNASFPDHQLLTPWQTGAVPVTS
ncbi:hypothetical protein FKM82_018326 [Ascaphus truei]